jgi:phosphoribosylcarboxyaminoimidazole (NCAIR) mutase
MMYNLHVARLHVILICAGGVKHHPVLDSNVTNPPVAGIPVPNAQNAWGSTWLSSGEMPTEQHQLL